MRRHRLVKLEPKFRVHSGKKGCDAEVWEGNGEILISVTPLTQKAL